MSLHGYKNCSSCNCRSHDKCHYMTIRPSCTVFQFSVIKTIYFMSTFLGSRKIRYLHNENKCFPLQHAKMDASNFKKRKILWNTAYFFNEMFTLRNSVCLFLKQFWQSDRDIDNIFRQILFPLMNLYMTHMSITFHDILGKDFL